MLKLSETLSDKERKIEEKKEFVENSTDEKYELTSSINADNANYENLIRQEKNLNNELNQTISELDSERMNKSEINSNFLKIEKSKNDYEKQLEEISVLIEESDKKIKEYENDILKLENEYRINDSRCNFLKETEREKEGYIKSVKSLLLECEKNQELAKGMHGVLANLINTPKEYETAIEIALGGTLQNIVTDTEEVAKKLVEHLRKNNLGRASFLPITSVKGKKLDKINQKNIDGKIIVASDVVNTDKKYEQIIISLLGRTVITDDLEQAIALSKQNGYSFRIVTLKGDIINPSGSISGGSNQTKTVNIIRKSKTNRRVRGKIKRIKK